MTREPRRRSPDHDGTRGHPTRTETTNDERTRRGNASPRDGQRPTRHGSPLMGEHLFGERLFGEHLFGYPRVTYRSVTCWRPENRYIEKLVYENNRYMKLKGK